MIPLLDLKAQYSGIREELEAAVLTVLADAEYVSGPHVQAFETKFAAYCGAREAVALNSGTSALHLALLALDIGPGDEGITVAMTFVATVAAICYAGATPVLVDVDPDAWTMDPAALERAITPRTRAIMPVHLHGRLSDMEAILAVARRHGIPLIEDAAQAHGAEHDGRRAGTFGEIGCFSFYPGKNLGACGEGGAIVTDRPELAAAIRTLRDWGQDGRYNHIRRGFNYRMDGVQGAALSVKLARLPFWTEQRQQIAARYDTMLSGSGLATPAEPRGREHVYHVYAVRTPARERLRERLQQGGVATGLHYPVPVHLQPAYTGLGYRAGDLPVSERLAGELLSLPIYPELTAGQQEYICDLVRGETGRSPAIVGRSGRRPTADLDPTGRLAGKLCLVTGGAGFVGSHIVDLLVEADCSEILVIDNMVRGRPANLERALASGRVRMIEADIRDATTIQDLVAGTDTVFHQAALRITQCAHEPRAAFDVMVAATYDLVEACVQTGVRKVVMASSASVYGMAQQFPTTERQNPYDNRTLYGAAKAFGEGLLRSFNEMFALDYVALRYFNVYGPRMDVHGRYTEVLVRWMERLDAGQPPIIFGDGLQTMDMIHVEDVARANIRAAVADTTDVALNVGSGTETSLLDLARALGRVMDRPSILPVFQPARTVNPVPRRLADIGEAQRRIGFTAEVPLENGLAELVRWWRNTLVREAAE